MRIEAGPPVVDLAGWRGEPTRVLLQTFAPDAEGLLEEQAIRASMFEGAVRYGESAATDLAATMSFAMKGDVVEGTVPPLDRGGYWYAVRFRSVATDPWETIVSGALVVS